MNPDHANPGGGNPPNFLTDLFANALDPGYAEAASRRAGRPQKRRGWS